MPISVKRLLLGKPLATERAHHEKLNKILALPIFASDALSSVAYATEEIMAALLVAGAMHFGLTPWLSLGIVLLLAIVVTSYRQIVMAYPSGGGAYVVARDNLGEIPAQAAGAALLVDYILTVAVSVSAGVAAIVSLVKTYYPDSNLAHYTVPMCLIAVLLISTVNMRGVRESGAAFAVPAYGFIAIMYLLVGIGLYNLWVQHGGLMTVHTPVEMQAARAYSETHGGIETGAFGLFLVLHAFASGCTALTGVEAISNGVQAFKPPESRNAAITMTILGCLLGTIFMGVSYLAVHINALPPNAVLQVGHEALGETVVSQVGRAIFGTGSLYLILQIVTCIILILAANTSFAGFPRLCALQAQDGFLPRQLANVGDRLVYDNGIKVLTILSCALIVFFGGDVHSLIPLYAIGVFLSFTLSQAGMVKRWAKLKATGWQLKMAINAFGTVATFIVLLVFGVVKFMHGAWIVVVLIPALILLFFRIKAHYRSVAEQLSLKGYRPRQGVRHHVLVLVPDIHRGVIPALQYARSISPDAKALHISIDPSRERRLRERWTLWSRGVPLVILPSPYRSLVTPVLDYVDNLQKQEQNSLITVVVPEFVPTGWWPNLLHGQAGLILNIRLRSRRNVVVTNVPYHIEALVKLDSKEDAVAEHTGTSHDNGSHSGTAQNIAAMQSSSAASH